MESDAFAMCVKRKCQCLYDGRQVYAWIVARGIIMREGLLLLLLLLLMKMLRRHAWSRENRQKMKPHCGADELPVHREG